MKAWVITIAVLIGSGASLAVLTPDPTHPRSGAPALRQLVPPQGVYEGCAPGDGVRRCTKRLNRIAGAGFTYILNYSIWYGTDREVRRYARAARAAGVQLIWPLNHPAWTNGESLLNTYERLARSCDCRGNRGLRAYAVTLAKRLPATWGFYVGDEELPSLAPRVARLSRTVRRLAPGASQLYVARPGRALLEPFLPTVDIAGADSYPVGYPDPSVAQTATETRELTEASGIGTAMVLQAFSWSDYLPSIAPDFPTEDEMRAMKNDAIAFGRPDLILWYSYQDITRSATPHVNWRALRRAAAP